MHDDYRIRKVYRISAPLGTDQSPHRQYEYWYLDGEKRSKAISYGQTIVLDALNRKIQYDHYDRRLEKITRFKDDNQTVLSTEHIKYPVNSDLKNAGDITLHAVLDGDNRPIFCRKYSYDNFHNPKKECLYGNINGKNEPIHLDLNTYDVSGGDFLEIERKYSEDGFNNLLFEKHRHGETKFFYEPNSSRISVKITEDSMHYTVRTYYYYDLNSLVIREIIDDGKSQDINDLTGVTERHIKYFTYNNRGLPVQIEHRYLDENNKEILERREVNTYAPYLPKVIKQEIYDSNNELFSVNSWEYDRYGNATYEKNGLGYEIHRLFDANSNLIREEGPLPGHIKLKSYDFMNRCIRDEEIYGNDHFVQHYSYDLCGNLISKVDPFGQETRFEYNAQNKLIKTLGPKILNEYGEWVHPVESKSYDAMGRISEEIDALGHVKRIYMTLYDKPYRIEYPDQTVEEIEYSLIGNIYIKKERNGTWTRFEKDSSDRPHRTCIYDKNGLNYKTETATYSSFHELSKTDAEGLTTFYAYNRKGQKISERTGDLLIEYGYDTMGRENFIRDLHTITYKQYDILNRLTEIKVTSLNGEVISKINQSYDEMDRVVLTVKSSDEGPQIEEKKYNSKGEICQEINALGYITFHHFKYDFINESNQQVCQHTITDPKGRSVTTTLDTKGRVATLEKMNAFYERIHKQSFKYDLVDNKRFSIEHVHLNGKEIRQIETEWNYNFQNQITSVIEAKNTPEQRITSFKYTASGLKEKVIKPDNIEIVYQYDAIGRLLELKSSDESIHQTFTYNSVDQIITATDQTRDALTIRRYDVNHYLSEEILENGLKLKYENDPSGKLLTLIYPDQSSTLFNYEGGRIKTIARKDYLVSYNYNLNGLPSSIMLPSTAGIITKSYDPLNRETAITSTSYSESLAYDETGNITHITSSNQSQDYTYDALDQILSETGASLHTYLHDSVNNCHIQDDKSANFNSLNQLLSLGDQSFTYDVSGNMITRENTSYKYDALDRLIEIQLPSKTYHYTYDPFNRRLSQSIITPDATLTQYFLYQGDCEIGLVTPSGEITQLRILGPGKGAEIGASIALELNQTLYIPIHNHLGSIVQLIGPSSTESYTYSAFGVLESQSTPTSPWLFSSKRYDPDTGLYYFGRRFYDPELHRWISCDPKGFDAGPNLYAYVFNNPLIFIDLFGLEHAGFWEYKRAEVPEDPVNYSRCGIAIGRSSMYHIPCLINGMNTDWDTFQKRVKATQLALDGGEVAYLYNGSKGFLLDFWECILQKNWYRSQPDKLFDDFIPLLLKRGREFNPDYQVDLILHSQGGIIGMNGLLRMDESLRQSINVYSFGTAQIIPAHGLCRKAENFLSTWDLVYYTDTSLKEHALRRDGTIEFLPSKNRFTFDHDFEGETYKTKYDSILKEMLSRERNR